MFQHNGKNVGRINSEGVFITKRYPKHFFRKFNGFGISENLAIELIRRGVRKVIILYREDITRWVKYEVDPRHFLKYGIRYNFEYKEWQRVLSLSEFKKGGQ